MKRLMKKEPSVIDLVAEAMSKELQFDLTPDQAIQRLCNEYLNATTKAAKK